VTVLVHMGAIVCPRSVAVSHVEKSFAEDGTAVDTAYVRRVDGMISELVWLASRLKSS
jgi:hypothetical protein